MVLAVTAPGQRPLMQPLLGYTNGLDHFPTRFDTNPGGCRGLSGGVCIWLAIRGHSSYETRGFTQPPTRVVF